MSNPKKSLIWGVVYRFKAKLVSEKCLFSETNQTPRTRAMSQLVRLEAPRTRQGAACSISPVRLLQVRNNHGTSDMHVRAMMRPESRAVRTYP
jgi:hypothetical protein